MKNYKLYFENVSEFSQWDIKKLCKQYIGYMPIHNSLKSNHSFLISNKNNKLEIYYNVFRIDDVYDWIKEVIPYLPFGYLDNICFHTLTENVTYIDMCLLLEKFTHCPYYEINQGSKRFHLVFDSDFEKFNVDNFYGMYYTLNQNVKIIDDRQYYVIGLDLNENLVNKLNVKLISLNEYVARTIFNNLFK